MTKISGCFQFQTFCRQFNSKKIPDEFFCNIGDVRHMFELMSVKIWSHT